MLICTKGGAWQDATLRGGISPTYTYVTVADPWFHIWCRLFLLNFEEERKASKPGTFPTDGLLAGGVHW